MTSIEHYDSEYLRIISWNILLDKTRATKGFIKPQAERLPSQIDTLSRVFDSMPDVVAVQEAEMTQEGHSGVTLARALGFEASYWYEHNRLKRKGECIGLFGQRVEWAKPMEIGDDKTAVFTEIGSVAIVNAHLRRQLWGGERAQQVGGILRTLHDSEKAIVMGDFNALRFERARRLLRAEGFRSVFSELKQPRPATFPAPLYREIMLTPYQQRLLPRGISIDDIYVRGLQVIEAGTFSGESDHRGVYATLAR